MSTRVQKKKYTCANRLNYNGISLTWEWLAVYELFTLELGVGILVWPPADEGVEWTEFKTTTGVTETEAEDLSCSFLPALEGVWPESEACGPEYVWLTLDVFCDLVLSSSSSSLSNEMISCLNCAEGKKTKPINYARKTTKLLQHEDLPLNTRVSTLVWISRPKYNRRSVSNVIFAALLWDWTCWRFSYLAIFRTLSQIPKANTERFFYIMKSNR